MRHCTLNSELHSADAWLRLGGCGHARRGQAIDLTTEHRVAGGGPTVEAEVARVEAAGGWIADGRVCDVIAVSRAFGDQEFKGAGMPGMLQRGVRCTHVPACARMQPNAVATMTNVVVSLPTSYFSLHSVFAFISHSISGLTYLVLGP